MLLAQSLIIFVQAWGAIGLVVALVFLAYGIDRVDPAAVNAYAFRPLLIPGIVVIWPLVLWRWWSLEQQIKNGCPSSGKVSDAKDAKP